MRIVDHVQRKPERWRGGVTTFPLVSAAGGSTGLCIFDQVCQAGHGAPAHKHQVEEVPDVKEGYAEMFVGAESGFAGENRSLLIPADVSHSFRNSGDKALRARATLAPQAFEAVCESAEKACRRWDAG